MILTNPLPSCPGQVQILAGQVIFYFTCPEKCIEYLGNTVILSHFQDDVECRAIGWNLDLSGPVIWYSFANQYFVHIVLPVTQSSSWISGMRRMAIEINSRSISLEVMWLSWDLNLSPLDLQPDMLLTALLSLASIQTDCICTDKPEQTV